MVRKMRAAHAQISTEMATNRDGGGKKGELRFVIKGGREVDCQKMSPGEAIRGLYAAFNARNATLASEFLTDDCLYEDLLLGPATICRGRKAFENALRLHPAFVMDYMGKNMPFLDLPDLQLVVDSVAEGDLAVGVEWHVEVNRKPFPLGRGLSQARICSKTGKIKRVVDIAEAPWRVIGLITAPLLNFLFRPYVALNKDVEEMKEPDQMSNTAAAATIGAARSSPPR